MLAIAHQYSFPTCSTEENLMSYANIKLTGGIEVPTAAQKNELIRGVTELLARVLGKTPATTVVIDEEAMDNWGINGESVVARRNGKETGTSS